MSTQHTQYVLLVLVLAVSLNFTELHPLTLATHSLAVNYTTHFIIGVSKYYYHSVGLGLRLGQSGWTMSTALVRNQD